MRNRFSIELDLLKEKLFLDILINIDMIQYISSGLKKEDYYNNKNQVADRINYCLYQIGINLIKLDTQYCREKYAYAFQMLSSENIVKICKWVKKSDIRFSIIYQKAWKLINERLNNLRLVITPILLTILFRNIYFYIIEIEKCFNSGGNKIKKRRTEKTSNLLCLIEDAVNYLESYCDIELECYAYKRMNVNLSKRLFGIDNNEIFELSKEGISELKNLVMPLCIQEKKKN